MSDNVRLVDFFKKKNYMLCSVFASILIALLLVMLNFNYIASSAEMYSTYDSCSAKEVWFTTSYVDEDCFYNLNGYYKAKKGNKSINADVFMQMEDVSYKNNLFKLKESFDTFECSLSYNTAISYDLEIGDSIEIGTYRFKIVKTFGSQPGLDQKYEHEGIIVISNVPELGLEINSYVFFSNDAENVLGDAKYVDLEKIKDNLKTKAFVFLLLFILEIIVYLTFIKLIKNKGRNNN